MRFGKGQFSSHISVGDMCLVFRVNGCDGINATAAIERKLR